MNHTTNLLAMGLPGNMEWLIILLVALLLFGRRLPEIARNMGKSMTEFKKGLHEAHEIKKDAEHQIHDFKDQMIDQAKEVAGLNELEKTP